MTERIILSVAALSLLALTYRKSDSLTFLLTSGLAVGILLTWAGISTLLTVGVVIYMLTALSISLTNLKDRGLSRLNQATLVLAGIVAFVANLFSLMHWPYASEIRLLPVFPLILYLISLFNGMLKRKEIGYLTILNLEFLLRII